jgi:hypothetical protein
MINQAWEIFRKQCIPIDASNNLVEMMKMAFYAGCIDVMAINRAIIKNGISKEDAVKTLQVIHKELEEYKESLK